MRRRGQTGSPFWITSAGANAQGGNAGGIVRAAQACQDGAMGYEVPFISGKDSLNNEFVCEDGSVIAIPSTLLISAISIVDDVNKCVTMDVKRSGNYISLSARRKTNWAVRIIIRFMAILAQMCRRSISKPRPPQRRKFPLRYPPALSQAAMTARKAGLRSLLRKWPLRADLVLKRIYGVCRYRMIAAASIAAF